MLYLWVEAFSFKLVTKFTKKHQEHKVVFPVHAGSVILLQIKLTLSVKKKNLEINRNIDPLRTDNCTFKMNQLQFILELPFNFDFVN
jgi:hypothetical protein